MTHDELLDESATFERWILLLAAAVDEWAVEPLQPGVKTRAEKQVKAAGELVQTKPSGVQETSRLVCSMALCVLRLGDLLNALTDWEVPVLIALADGDVR